MGVSAALKSAGASKAVAVGSGYVAAAVIVLAVAYDGLKHHWTYDERKQHVRGEVEAGLRAYGQGVLEALNKNRALFASFTTAKAAL